MKPAPAELAAGYAEAEGEPRFLARRAVVWALSAFALLQAVGIALDVGFRRGAEAADTPGGEHVAPVWLRARQEVAVRVSVGQ